MPSAPFELPAPKWKQQAQRRLLTWYTRHARDLPWRRTRQLYPIWISEVMLQQTQVATVIDYFERFLARFPDVATLAAASEEEVLRLWEGLGYYRRARNLHRAAQVIVEHHRGEVPEDIATLRELPGIGRYTAGAILSLALDARHPILEANTKRLLSRLLAYPGDVSAGAGQELLWQFAEAFLPAAQAGRFNQALMELGSRICTPREPRCVDCPLVALCPTSAQGLQAQIPAPKPRRAYETVSEAAVVVQRGTRVLVRRCQPTERWAGLWDFPRFPVCVTRGARFRAALAEQTRALTGLDVEPSGRLALIRHGVTRFRITLYCHQAKYIRGRLVSPELRWVTPSELATLPLSSTGRQISRLL